MGCPRKSRNLVLAPPRVAASARLHFKNDEVGDPSLVEAPGGTQAGDAATNDDHLLAGTLWPGAWRQRRSQQMAPTPAVVHEAAGRTAAALTGKANQSGAQKQAAGNLQRLIAFHSFS